MSAQNLALLSAVAATGAGAAVHVVVPDGKDNVPVAITGTFVGTVSIDGSMDGTTWVSLLSKTAAFAGDVPVMPYMRGNVTAYTSGAITAAIFADKKFGG